MWAITPRGAGRAPGARLIRDGWALRPGETFTVSDGDYDPQQVLDADGVSLRAATPADHEAEATGRRSREAAVVLDERLGRVLLEALWALRQDTGTTGGQTKAEFKQALQALYTAPRR